MTCYTSPNNVTLAYVVVLARVANHNHAHPWNANVFCVYHIICLLFFAMVAATSRSKEDCLTSVPAIVEGVSEVRIKVWVGYVCAPLVRHGDNLW